MTDQPTKTKQQLLAELESIMSMLDDDAVIPTLDTVVDPKLEDSPEDKPAQAAAEPQPEGSTEPTEDAPSIQPAPSVQPSLTEDEPSEATQPHNAEQRQLLNAELDNELREAMEIDIKIPEVNVPNSQTLFGNTDDYSSDFSSDFSDDNSRGDSDGSPESSRETQEQESATVSQSVKNELEVVSEQQNPFPAPGRKPHLFNGETEAKEPLPGQQHLFDAEQADKESPSANTEETSEPAVVKTVAESITASLAQSIEEPIEELVEEPTEEPKEESIEKPANPFKSSANMGSAYPPATLLSSMRRQKQSNIFDPAIEEPSTGNEEPSAGNEEPQATSDEVEPQADFDLELSNELDLTLPTEPDHQADSDSQSADATIAAGIETTANNNAEALVDDIVEEYMPKIEAELRRRLMASLDSQFDF